MGTAHDSGIFDEIAELRQASTLDQAALCRLAYLILTSRAESRYATIANYVCGQALLYFADQLDAYQEGESAGSNFLYILDLITMSLRAADYQGGEEPLSQLIELTRRPARQN